MKNILTYNFLGDVSLRQTPPTYRLFSCFWCFFTIIAFFYLRNQLRPITRLANAAEAFGLGENVPMIPVALWK